MNPMTEKPRIIVKAKNIQLVLDYCLQEKTEFTVIPRGSSNDEWEIELSIKTISKAIEWGMFMKTNRLELAVNELFNKPEIAAAAPKPKAKPREKKVPATDLKNETDFAEILHTPKKQTDQTSLLSFDMESDK
jgi:hypothetical protein